MDNPEKLATTGTQDDEKQNKNTTQYVLDTSIHKQTQTRQTRHAHSYKQLEVKTRRYVSGIIAIRYTHSHKIIKPNNLKVVGSK